MINIKKRIWTSTATVIILFYMFWNWLYHPLPIYEGEIKIKGLTAGMTYHLAGCCTPIIGDQIVGIVTAGIGVSVHTIDCELLSSYADSPERWLDISWETSSGGTQNSTTRISVTLKNPPGSLGKVTTIIAKNNGNISNINFTTRKTDFFEIIIDIEV